MAFQNIIGYKLGQAEMPTTYFTVYTVPPNVRTYIKDIDICNTAGSSLRFYVHLVPIGKTAAVDNALFYNAPINGTTTVQWTGSQILNAGDTIQVKASAAGVTVSVTGGEAT
jgi:hypothetical protein